jgi:hypothetical protein
VVVINIIKTKLGRERKQLAGMLSVVLVKRHVDTKNNFVQKNDAIKNALNKCNVKMRYAKLL